VAVVVNLPVDAIRNRGATRPGATTAMDADAIAVCLDKMKRKNRGWMQLQRLYVGPKILWPGS
jgi:hypothetical protein